jgi:hypothetical protein
MSRPPDPRKRKRRPVARTADFAGTKSNGSAPLKPKADSAQARPLLVKTKLLACGQTLPAWPDLDDGLFMRDEEGNYFLLVGLMGLNLPLNVVLPVTGPGKSQARAFLRGMIESAFGIDPNDYSPAAVAARKLRCFRDIDGLEFILGFGAHNYLIAVTPDRPGWYSIEERLG